MDDEKNSRDPIWSIYSKSKVWFYRVVFVVGSYAFFRVLCDEWDRVWTWKSLWRLAESGTLIEIGKGIFSSVVIVWFIFQTGEVIVSAYQDYLDRKAAREQKEQQEENERVQKIVVKIMDNARKSVGEDATAKEAFQAMESACSYSRDNK